MKVFLSLGMSGREEKDVLHDIEEATLYAKAMMSSAYTECEMVDTYQQEEAPEDAGPTYYLGRSIQILGSCDQVWFINDWKNYRGCRVEYEVCKIYGISHYELDLRAARLRLCKIPEDSKTQSAYQTFQFFKQSISNARDAIEDTKNLISEYKDLYQDMYHNANLLLDASENAMSLGLNTIDHLVHIIETESDE